MESCYVFDKKSGLRTDLALQTALEAAKDPHQVVWINLFQPTPEELEVVSQALNLHELTLEDLQSARVRPKVEEFEDHMFVVFKALNLNEGEDVLDVINLNLLLFKNTLITAHQKPLPSVKALLDSERAAADLHAKRTRFCHVRHPGSDCRRVLSHDGRVGRHHGRDSIPYLRTF